jgi:hypothetical protein
MFKKLLLAAAVLLGSCLQPGLAEAGDTGSRYQNGTQYHRDGGGYTVRYGNTVRSYRYSSGVTQQYSRQGNWEYYRDNRGTYGARYYDNHRGVQKFDYRSPSIGRRVIGENPYPSNYYSPRWSQVLPW